MAIETNIGPDDHYFTGEDKSLPFTITNAAGGIQDITGWSLSWMVKRKKTNADAVVTKTTDGGIVLTLAVAGLCTVTVSDDDIAALVGGRLYYHELKRTDPGLETVLSFGTFMLGQAVHR